jgi:hypothetical protein
MDIFNVLRSEYNANATKAAFEMNMCIQKQIDEKSLESMDRAIRNYVSSMNCIGVLDQLEKSYNKSPLNQEQNVEENED